MSRSEQWVGLSEAAVAFLNDNCIHKVTLSIDVIGKIPEFIASKDMITRRCVVATAYTNVDGAFGGSWPLQKFTHNDGTDIYEVVQCEPWSGGPITFTCLQMNGQMIPETTWTETQINNYL